MSTSFRETASGLLADAVDFGFGHDVTKEELLTDLIEILEFDTATSAVLGWLEIDHSRGVIYFHRKEGTLLRICRLPAPIPEDTDFIDITLFALSGGEPSCSYNQPTSKGGDKNGEHS